MPDSRVPTTSCHTHNLRLPSLVPSGGAQSTDEEASLTTALNATFRFALPDECLPATAGTPPPVEAMDWIAKGPPRVRP